MPIVGFTFTKLHAEKSETAATSIKLNTNMAVSGMERVPLSLGASKEEALKLNFTFSSAFEPKVGQVLLEGFLLYIDNKPLMEGIEKSWKKDKKLPRDLNSLIMNQIHSKCSVQAVILTKDIGLPPPFPLPHLNLDDKKTP